MKQPPETCHKFQLALRLLFSAMEHFYSLFNNIIIIFVQAIVFKCQNKGAGHHLVLMRGHDHQLVFQTPAVFMIIVQLQL